jgi:hypothetical protein
MTENPAPAYTPNAQPAILCFYPSVSIFAGTGYVKVGRSRRSTTKQVNVEMTDRSDECSREDLGTIAGNRVVCEQLQELTWAMLDEQINDNEFHLLDTLLLSDEIARDSYISCVQLHAVLMSHFATSPSAGLESVTGSTIFGLPRTDVYRSFEEPFAQSTE